MKKGYISKHLCLIGVMVMVVSCKKFVAVDPPTTQILTSTVFNDGNSATAAQLVVYAKMALDPLFIDRMTGLSADELFTYYNNQSYRNIYSNAMLVPDELSFNEWAPAYNYIYYENTILENLQVAGGVSQKIKKQLMGEAYFMRAYWYFNLVNLYGDVPLILTTDYKTNTIMPRTSSVQVYQQVINDLKNAQDMLNPNYVDGTDTAIASDRVRPTSWAATAMLARTYLYAGKYDSAEAQATVIINNSSTYGLSPLTGNNSVFKKNSTEAIWQLMVPASVGYAPEGSYFVMLTAPPATGTINGSWTIGGQLLNAFEPGDQRRANWIGTITSTGGTTYYFPFKYQSSTNATVPSKEYSMVLRLGEQYLIRAEARAQQNSNLNGAINDLNVIRTRASLPGLATTLTQAQVLSAIAHERQVELFTEGHRWFDLKRTKAIDTVMSIVTPQKSVNTWKSYQQLYPIPQENIDNSLNIHQNAGY
jgi:starch-binding outer membrane protein, SusD/RagB family